MSFADTLKNKKKSIILVVAAIVLVAVVVTQLLPLGEEKPIGPPVVIKKAKIEAPEETAKADVPAGVPVKPAVKADKSPVAEEKKLAIKPAAPSTEKAAKAADARDKPLVEKKGDKRWAVNVVSLTYENEARHLASKLKKAGYNAYVTEFTKDGVLWYRVRAGFYSSKQNAAAAAKKIVSKLKVKTAPWVAFAPKNEVSKYGK